MGWLRRLGHNSFWKTLHIEDLKDKSLLFNPYKSNETNLQKAIKNMQNPMMKQIYISLLKCRSNLIEIDPKMSLFLPVFGEHRTTQNNTPALSEWTIGSRVINLITTFGNFIGPDAHIKNAQLQPSSLQYIVLKNQFKRSLMDTYSLADKNKIRDNSPFNIYGRIVFKLRSGCSYFYRLLNFKANKTLLWETSRLSLEKDWEKHNISITIEIEQYEQIIRAVLNIRHFNYLKQFMIKLLRNNLYFKNVTLKFSDSETICNSCKSEKEDRLHFFKHVRHASRMACKSFEKAGHQTESWALRAIPVVP